MLPSEIIPAFDQHLLAEGLVFEAVVLGGAALHLLGVIQRPTDDCDVLDPQIPEAVLAAARAFAAPRGLRTDWLNSRAHDFVGVPGCLPGRNGANVHMCTDAVSVVVRGLRLSRRVCR